MFLTQISGLKRKLPPEWKQYCSLTRFEANQNKNKNKAVQSGESRICFINRTDTINVGESAAFELDSHADTSVLGKNFTILEYTNMSCDVCGFSGTPKLHDVPIVSGATAWNDENGTTFILVTHHALWIGSKLKHSLINPKQVRFNGVRVMDEFRRLGPSQCVLQDFGSCKFASGAYVWGVATTDYEGTSESSLHRWCYCSQVKKKDNCTTAVATVEHRFEYRRIKSL